MTQPQKLTEREEEVLELIAQGYRDKEIAMHLSISICTVHNHVQHILRRLGVSSRVAAAQIHWQQHAHQNGEK